jgi:hypothetical protein
LPLFVKTVVVEPLLKTLSDPDKGVWVSFLGSLARNVIDAFVETPRSEVLAVTKSFARV